MPRVLPLLAANHATATATSGERKALLRILPLLAGLAACSSLPPAGQLVLHVDTDAPLPAAPGAPIEDPPALFDRVRIEIFEPGAAVACAGCSRDFAVTAADFAAGTVSVGVVPRPGVSGYRARVRLFRSGGTLSGEPRPGSTLEVVAALPVTSKEGVLDASVLLRTADVARPVGDLDHPVDAALGPPGKSLVGTWAGARAVPCVGQAQAGEVCIPGGAFWMGDPRLDTADSGEYEGTLERLVVLSSFFLDAAEVTVAAFRPSGLAIRLTPNGPSNDPSESGGAIAPCTFTSKPGPNEARPVDCISWHLARAYCASRGRDLPSEARYELVAGGRRSEPAVWGSDAPACGDAVFGRAPGDVCSKLALRPENGGTGARDRLTTSGGDVVDLMGNVSEWAVDQWNRDTEPCWGTGLFTDPVCTTPGQEKPAARSYRGANFASQIPLMRAALRARIAGEQYAVAPEIGFRCARDDAP